MIYYKSRIFTEAEDDNNISSDSTQSSDNIKDNTADQTDTQSSDDTTDTDNNDSSNNNENNEDDNNLDMSTETEDNGDFSIDSEDDTPSDNESSSDDSSNDDNQDEPKEDESKEKYDGIYDELSDTEKINKDNKLKEDFKTLYEAICTLIKRCSLIPNTSDNLKVMKRIVLNLTDLKQYIIYYINRSYSSKSYIENSIEFYKYLAIYNGINNIFTSIEKLNKNDEK